MKKAEKDLTRDWLNDKITLSEVARKLKVQPTQAYITLARSCKAIYQE